MKRLILTYGLISGGIVAASMVWGIMVSASDGESMATLEYVGYLIMLVALSVIFIGIKKYRDQELGGVITFGTGMLVGLGISVVAAIIYVVTWEIYLAQTDHAFINDYIADAIASKKAAGISGADLDAAIAELDKMREQYAKPLYRIGVTFLEILPVGILISLISAAVLRKSEILPASS